MQNCGGRTGILLKKIMNRAWDGLGEALEGCINNKIHGKSVSKDVMNGDLMYPTSLGVKLLAGNVLETHSMVTICPDSMLEVAADLRRQVAGRLPCSLLLQVYTPFCESTYFF
ncbi:hypothetical protein C5167_036850 [Papaver somniferum]|uniref:Uncharacterized protein n=1 Tax=Papaver somniferum TaxID=3469 RepID=A0A4Y7I4V6_PAPSO|nr:hypothetical protein C5167_036850 [Papaver somniferum]